MGVRLRMPHPAVSPAARRGRLRPGARGLPGLAELERPCPARRQPGPAPRGRHRPVRPHRGAPVDLRYRLDGRDVVLRAAELAPFLVYETATLRQLAASSSLPNLVALVISRLAR